MDNKENWSRINPRTPSENSIFHVLFSSHKKKAKPPEVQEFNIIKPISRGAYGKVYLGYKKNNPKKLFAIKVMRKSDMINKNMVSHVVTERNALALARSPFIVQLFYSLQTETCIYLVMEYMVGGDLKSLLSANGYFEESFAAFYVAEVTLALEYLHRHGIIHRDIKPDNMLLSSRGHVKLTDFGLCDTTLHRDLEISDLVSDTPQTKSWHGELEQEYMKRTPGQLLSLTSHLSFSANCMSLTKRTQVDRRDSSTPKGRHQFTKSSRLIYAAAEPHHSTGDADVQSLGAEITKSCDSVFYPGNTNENETENPLNKGDNPVTICENSENPASKSNCDKVETTTSSSSSGSDSFHTCDDLIQAATSSPFVTCNSLSTKPNFQNQSGGIQGIKRKRNLLKLVSMCSPPQTPLSSFCHTGLTTDIDTLNISSPRKRKDIKKSPEQLLFDGHHGDKVTSEVEEHGVLDVSVSSLMGAEEHLEGKDIGSHLVVQQFATPMSRMPSDFGSHPIASKAVITKSTRFELPKSPDSFLLAGEQSINSQDSINTSAHPCTPAPGLNDHPYRTPKSVRRGGQKNSLSSDQRILGTPDYLAPELLLRQGHGPAVDWWALGVCLYEFATGIPPFNDETAEKVFNNILQRKIEWPEGDEALSKEMVEAILSLLTLDPEKRPRADGIKYMPLFTKTPWDNLQDSTAPFIPEPENETDTCYFQARNILQHLQVSSCDM